MTDLYGCSDVADDVTTAAAHISASPAGVAADTAKPAARVSWTRAGIAGAATLAALIVVLMMQHRDSAGSLLSAEYSGGNSGSLCGSSCTELSNPPAGGLYLAATATLTAGYSQFGRAADAGRRTPGPAATLQNLRDGRSHSAAGDTDRAARAARHGADADRAVRQGDGGMDAAASIADSEAESVRLAMASMSSASASHPAGPRPAALSKPIDAAADSANAKADSVDEAAGPIAGSVYAAADPDEAASDPIHVADGPVDAAVGPIRVSVFSESVLATRLDAAADVGAGGGATAAGAAVATLDVATEDLATAAVAHPDIAAGCAGTCVAVAGRDGPRGFSAQVAEVPERARARLLARLVRLTPLGSAWSAALARRSA